MRRTPLTRIKTACLMMWNSSSSNQPTPKGCFPSDSLLPKLFLLRLIRNPRDHYRATPLAGCFDAPIWDNTVFLAVMALFRTFIDNTRAVPLVRKENAHKGRVFFARILRDTGKGPPHEGSLLQKVALDRRPAEETADGGPCHRGHR